MPIVITADELGQKICEVMGLDSSTISRLVIDLRAGETVRVQAFVFGEERLLDVDFSELADVEPEIVDLSAK